MVKDNCLKMKGNDKRSISKSWNATYQTSKNGPIRQIGVIKE